MKLKKNYLIKKFTIHGCFKASLHLILCEGSFVNNELAKSLASVDN